MSRKIAFWKAALLMIPFCIVMVPLAFLAWILKRPEDETPEGAEVRLEEHLEEDDDGHLPTLADLSPAERARYFKGLHGTIHCEIMGRA